MQGYIEQLETLDARQFAIAVKRLADALSYGTDRSPFLGSGVEYVQSRQYQFGDPVRSMDWKVTARTGTPHIKEFETPKRLPCYLLIDTSASMMMGSAQRSKYETALHLAGGLALACLERVSPVGVLGVGETDLHVRPTLGRDQVLQWLLKLRRFRFDEGTTLSRRLRELQPGLLNRTLLLILSDLHDRQAVPLIRQLNQQHECVVVQLRDPAEDGLAGGGIVRGVEAESSREFVAPIGQNRLSQESVERDLRRGGVDHVLIRTDRPFAHLVRHFFASRGVFNRGAR
ncbi:MAG TPA: DUF58 domain-containing protein [Planctomycetes bacterium]|nr:DUF58 domain-containing protein [Fuerstiella sp.]HIK92202.1 DUF58 domain-containing protein [Planctomycetota bacterium]